MKRLILPAIAAISIGTLLPACSGNSRDTIAFTTVTGGHATRLLNSARDFGRDSDITYYDTVALMLPADILGQDITALRDSIISAALDTVCSDPSEAMKALYGEYVADIGYDTVAVAATADELYTADGFTMVTANVFSMTPHRLTYRITNASYPPGAANGMTASRYITYDIDSARIVTLATIFTPAGLEKLPQLIAGKARKMAAILGPTNITALPSDGNFYVDLDGTMAFVYQPMEVASHAQGEVAVPFYPYILSDYMTPDGLAFFGLAGR